MLPSPSLSPSNQKYLLPVSAETANQVRPHKTKESVVCSKPVLIPDKQPFHSAATPLGEEVRVSRCNQSCDF